MAGAQTIPVKEEHASSTDRHQRQQQPVRQWAFEEQLPFLEDEPLIFEEELENRIHRNNRTRRSMTNDYVRMTNEMCGQPIDRQTSPLAIVFVIGISSFAICRSRSANLEILSIGRLRRPGAQYLMGHRIDDVIDPQTVGGR